MSRVVYLLVEVALLRQVGSSVCHLAALDAVSDGVRLGTCRGLCK